MSSPLNISVPGDQYYGDTTFGTDGYGQQSRLILGTNNRWDVDGGETIIQHSHEVWTAPVVDRVAVRLGYGHNAECISTSTKSPQSLHSSLLAGVGLAQPGMQAPR